MPKPTCSIPECETTSYRAGRCVTHYRHALESGEVGSATPCKWPECRSFVSARGFCHSHYARASRLSDLETPWETEEAKRSERENAKCHWPECDRPVKTAGLCNRDYQRARKLGDFETPWITYEAKRAPKPCRWPGCDRPSEYAGFCSRDYSRSKATANTIDPWNDWDTSGECVVCGKRWEGGRNRNKRVCSASCSIAEWRALNPDRARASKMDGVRRRRARLAGVEVEKFTIADVRGKHGDDCYICGKSINYALRFPHPGSPSLDHVHPLSAGGAHTLENVAMTHLECNLKKHAAPAVRLPQPLLQFP